MKRCLACKSCFGSNDWTCPRCGYRPALRNGIFQFAEDPPNTRAGFKPDYFARLAGIEGTNFWFRARNVLIQWALRNYFPNAKSFFEIGCGTGFVLAGIHENFPEMRLAGSEIFADGLVFARARLPKAELYQMDARCILFECEFDVVGTFDVLEHLVEDERALAQMFNAVRPSGGLLVTVPQHRFLWSASDQYANASTSLQPHRIAQKSRERWVPDRANHFFQFALTAAYDFVAHVPKARSGSTSLART